MPEAACYSDTFFRWVKRSESASNNNSQIDCETIMENGPFLWGTTILICCVYDLYFHNAIGCLTIRSKTDGSSNNSSGRYSF